MARWRETPAEFLDVDAIVAGLSAENRPDTAAEYAAKGVRLGPAYLRDRPDDVVAMLLMGGLLDYLKRPADAEAWLTQATRTEPKNPRMWRALGVHHFNQALRVALGDKTPMLDDPMLLLVLATPQKRRELREHLLRANVNGRHKASDLLAKAGDCFDWAVLLAPDSAPARVFRCSWQQTLLLTLREETSAQDQHALENVLAVRGILRENHTATDALRAAELSPDPFAVGFAVLAAYTGPRDESARTPDEKLSAYRAPFRKFQATLARLARSPDAVTARNAARMQVLLLGMVFEDHAGAAKLLAAMPADLDDTSQDNLAMFVYAGLDDAAGMATFMQKKVAVKPDAQRSFLLAKSLIRAKRFAEAKTHLRAAVKAFPADPRLALALAAVLVGEGTKADMAEADRMLSAVEAVYDKKLAAVAATAPAPWDEQAAGIPPMKDRAPLCGEILSADDQERLRHTRVNRVLWLGLAGRLDDATTAVRRWGCADRPADQPVMDALHLIKPDVAPAGDILPPPFSPGFGRGR